MSYGDDPHLGRGWAFPPRWEPVDGRRRPPCSEVRTRPRARPGSDADPAADRVGSRVMRPTLGAGVDRYVFEPRTTDVCYRLAHDVERALLLWEPRVIVDAVEAEPAGEADERIDVTDRVPPRPAQPA